MHIEEGSMIRKMVDTIVRVADPDAVILFGSRNRGDYRPDSDVDLLIIEREPFSHSEVAARKLLACILPCVSWQ